MSEKFIEFKNVTYTYEPEEQGEAKPSPALCNIDLTVNRGEFVAVLGHNGSGKSTLAKLTNAILVPESGTVTVDGIDTSDEDRLTDIRRKVGMVFQRPNPFPTMSIKENVLAGLQLNNKRASKSELDETAEKALRGANLWEEVKNRLDLPGSGLSGGQQQRLCIARAIAMSPEVLLMDEPCSALDPISTLAIEDLIQELKANYTIVIVTHNMQQAARVSDTTAFFNIAGTGQPGKLIEMDSTEKIFSTPTVKATEDYITGRFG